LLSTTLSTGMAGISLHMQWPLHRSRMAVFTMRTSIGRFFFENYIKE
jgi:hypothetical protein